MTTGVATGYRERPQELFRRVIDAVPVPEVSGAPGQVTEQILAGLAGRLASEPVASLTMLRSMLTNPEAASAAEVIELLRPCVLSLAADRA